MTDEREFRIHVRRRWTLLILPTLAALYFVFLVVLGVARWRVRGVSNDVLALGGLAFFVLVILIELPFLLRRSGPRPPEASRDEGWQDEPPEPPPSARLDVDDERVSTDESQQGLRVIEYSSPAKSRNRGAVYTKTYVPVTKGHVLRIETIAALPADL